MAVAAANADRLQGSARSGIRSADSRSAPSQQRHRADSNCRLPRFAGACLTPRPRCRGVGATARPPRPVVHPGVLFRRLGQLARTPVVRLELLDECRPEHAERRDQRVELVQRVLAVALAVDVEPEADSLVSRCDLEHGTRLEILDTAARAGRLAVRAMLQATLARILDVRVHIGAAAEARQVEERPLVQARFVWKCHLRPPFSVVDRPSRAGVRPSRTPGRTRGRTRVPARSGVDLRSACLGAAARAAAPRNLCGCAPASRGARPRRRGRHGTARARRSGSRS